MRVRMILALRAAVPLALSGALATVATASSAAGAPTGAVPDATPSTTIWQSRLPDGTLELSDRPPPSGSAQVGQRSYALTRDSAARHRAEQERAYWRMQSEGFNRRQQGRGLLEQEDAERRARERTAAESADVGRPIWYGTPIVRPWALQGGVPYPHPTPQRLRHAVGAGQGSGASPYTSTPGAVQGRATGGFIGSGFSAGR